MNPARTPDARTSDARIDAALRTLDAALPTPLDEHARVRADAALQRITAQARAPRNGAARDPLLPRPRRTGLRVAGVGLAAGIAALCVSTPSLLGGGGTAYAASWTPVPTAASRADVSAAQEACADSANSLLGDGGASLRPRLAERRGDLVLLAMDDGTAEPAVLMCIVGLPAGEEDAEFIAGGGGGGVVRPAADAVSDAGVYEQRTPGDELSVIDGLAGEHVAAITVHAPGGRVVQATVQDGHYAAWWPGPAMREGTEPLLPGGGGGCAGECDGTHLVPAYTLDVTLEDGTVLRGVSAQDL
ncbi:hypothetical protein [Kineococcus sp. SYSU DK005]|uniref:hypothetical protein n=1 Tax=Kineococcus sp. SYSU DK005 TaxID=3383126 RepID=UPI003D7EA637